MSKRFTAIILGAGPAGYTCAVRLAQLGAKACIIERDYVGGICVNWGCTPSKAMIESAKIARIARKGMHYGIKTGKIAVDFARVAKRRDDVIEKSREEIAEMLASYNITVLQGEGEILKPGCVRVHMGKLDPDGKKMRKTGKTQDIEAEHIVIATGSAPLVPGFLPENDPSIVSSNRLISIKKLPKELTVVGGGVIGLEFATIFSSLGTNVRIIEFLDRVLAQMDPEISREITHLLTERGVKIFTSYKVLSIDHGKLTIENQKTKKKETWKSPLNLIAIGRKAVVNKEAYDALGLDYTDRGVDIDNEMRTNVPGVWAIGDATGKSILAHVGMQQGMICAENLMAMEKGKRDVRAMDYSVIPAVVYTLPEIAAVGTIPQNLKGVTISTVPFTKNLRALIEDDTEGFVKVWIKDGILLAAQVMGVRASEIIQELANAIALKTPIEDIATIIHAHPTYSEITRAALERALGRMIDQRNFHSA